MLGKKGMLLTIAIVIICGIILQGLFYLVDGKDSPQKAAIEFAKAYYGLNVAMTDSLCEERKIVDDVDIVNKYIDSVAAEAVKRGFGIDYLRCGLFNIGTRVISKDDDNAVIRITGKKKVEINPLYMLVAKIFNIGETTHVDETINLVKEDGMWKVCGNLFALPEA
ncbi:MAG: hypothetical protein JJV92_08200 [Desulfosarcina sp.]|nr:hypothetical protein [Desulfobacterales bacterium]